MHEKDTKDACVEVKIAFVIARKEII